VPASCCECVRTDSNLVVLRLPFSKSTSSLPSPQDPSTSPLPFVALCPLTTSRSGRTHTTPPYHPPHGVTRAYCVNTHPLSSLLLLATFPSPDSLRQPATVGGTVAGVITTLFPSPLPSHNIITPPATCETLSCVITDYIKWLRGGWQLADREVETVPGRCWSFLGLE
jgi:hypothetical protein